MAELLIRKAARGDAGAVASLYQSAVGSAGCTWNELYPSQTEIDGDLTAGCLYVLLLRDAVIGASSVVPENELDEEPFWHIHDGNQREIARVVIAPAHRGHGYAQKLVSYMIERLRVQGCSAVHLLVAKGNAPANATYRRLGFSFVGECRLYGNEYFACEKAL